VTRRIVLITVGAVLIVFGLLVSVAGGALMAAFGSDDTLQSGSAPLYTPTTALVSKVATINGTSGAQTTIGRPIIRLAVTSPAGKGGIFLGVGPAAEVDRYLAGAPTDVVTDLRVEPFRLKTTRREGTRSPGPPATQTFWVAKASGGTAATLAWKISDGSYRLVVMNGNGSPGFNGNGRLVVKIRHLFAIGTGILIIGLLILAVGLLLLVLGVRTRSRSTAPQPGQGQGPAPVYGQPPVGPHQAEPARPAQSDEAAGQ
jgi:uncharacterized membrane protein